MKLFAFPILRGDEVSIVIVDEVSIVIVGIGSSNDYIILRVGDDIDSRVIQRRHLVIGD
jgi:hypothetical protein